MPPLSLEVFPPVPSVQLHGRERNLPPAFFSWLPGGAATGWQLGLSFPLKRGP